MRRLCAASTARTWRHVCARGARAPVAAECITRERPAVLPHPGAWARPRRRGPLPDGDNRPYPPAELRVSPASEPQRLRDDFSSEPRSARSPHCCRPQRRRHLPEHAQVMRPLVENVCADAPQQGGVPGSESNDRTLAHASSSRLRFARAAWWSFTPLFLSCLRMFCGGRCLFHDNSSCGTWQ